MNAKNTPDPWHVDIDRRLGVSVDAADGNDESPICVCHGPDAEANARLIAAAPDLLAACKRWAKWAEQCGTAGTAGIACDTFAAIAKAEEGG